MGVCMPRSGGPAHTAWRAGNLAAEALRRHGGACYSVSYRFLAHSHSLLAGSCLTRDSRPPSGAQNLRELPLSLSLNIWNNFMNF